MKPKGDAANARRVSDAITRHYACGKPLGAKIGQLMDSLTAEAADRRHVKASPAIARPLSRRLSGCG